MESSVLHGAARSLEERIDALRGEAAYRNYRYARERVLAMRDQAEASGHLPSAYWQEELSNFEYMLDAGPLVIEKLRHHTHHITGLRVFDYRSHRTHAQAQFAKKLKALTGLGGKDLLIPEWPGLGGFGFEINGGLFNIDTIKYYEVLIALEKGAALQEFRNAPERKLVWEIGAGWGGFPYQFKTLCPGVTYLISDFPELFLYSATYLMTAFPEARVRFWSEDSPERISAGWRDYDFIFVPNTALDQLTPDRVDLMINMVSFQEMTSAQVDGYVARAYALNCPLLYSLNRDRGRYNPEIESVSGIIEKYYWPHEIPVLPVPYMKMLDHVASEETYKHIVGWRRVKA